MSTCKDCLHYECCKIWEPNEHYFEKAESNGCVAFKPKADYAPVVRCKDCAYFYVEKQDEDFPYFCLHHSGPMRTAPNHFCSYGEKESVVKD